MSVNTVKQDGSLQRIAGGTLYADAPIGTISPFGGSVIPSGYLLCNGQAVSRTTYAELFAVIGTAFGKGDENTTFNLPDMRESVPKGAGLTGHTVGAHLDADGLAVGEFLDDRVQTHKHTVKYKNYTVSYPGTNSGLDYGVQSSNTTYSADKELTADSISNARAGATTEVKSVGVNYIIKAKQVAVPVDFMDAIDDAVDDKIKETIIRRDISSATATSSMSYKQAIADVLTRAGVKDFEKGIYVGSMKCRGQSPHNWIGMYQMNKMWSGDYGIMVNGNANNILFSATYASNAWEVKVYTSA